MSTAYLLTILRNAKETEVKLNVFTWVCGLDPLLEAAELFFLTLRWRTAANSNRKDNTESFY